MKIVVEVFNCDICGNKIQQPVIKIKYPVIFITEQTEGRKTAPYIDYQNLDCCMECQSKILKVKAHGAQGHNTYWLI